MDWRTELRKALQLQAIDRQIDALHSERQALVRDAQAEALEKDLHARRARIGGVEKDIAAAESRQRLQELERQSQEAERQRSSRRLYGGEVRDPKELEGLQKNMEGAARKIDELETSILEAMERATALREQLVHDREALARAEHGLAQLRHKNRVRLGEIDGQLPLLAARREEEATRIDAAVLREYERVRSRAGGIAVAAVTSDSCGACGFGLSTLGLSRIRAATVPVTCEHCGRLLVDA